MFFGRIKVTCFRDFLTFRFYSGRHFESMQKHHNCMIKYESKKEVDLKLSKSSISLMRLLQKSPGCPQDGHSNPRSPAAKLVKKTRLIVVAVAQKEDPISNASQFNQTLHLRFEYVLTFSFAFASWKTGKKTSSNDCARVIIRQLSSRADLHRANVRIYKILKKINEKWMISEHVIITRYTIFLETRINRGWWNNLKVGLD